MDNSGFWETLLRKRLVGWQLKVLFAGEEGLVLHGEISDFQVWSFEGRQYMVSVFFRWSERKTREPLEVEREADDETVFIPFIMEETLLDKIAKLETESSFPLKRKLTSAVRVFFLPPP